MSDVVAFTVGDMIEIRGHTEDYVYTVDAICLGALEQESVLHISPINQKDPDAYGKKQEMFVPLLMVRRGIEAGIFEFYPHLEES